MLNILLKMKLSPPPLSGFAAEIKMGWSGHGNCMPWEHTKAIQERDIWAEFKSKLPVCLKCAIIW